MTYLALSTEQFRKTVLDMVEKTAREEMKGVDESTGEEFQVVGKCCLALSVPAACASQCNCGVGCDLRRGDGK